MEIYAIRMAVFFLGPVGVGMYTYAGEISIEMEDIEQAIGGNQNQIDPSIDGDLDVLYQGYPGNRALIRSLVTQELAKNPSAIPNEKYRAKHVEEGEESGRLQRLVSVMRVLARVTENIHAAHEVSEQEALDQRDRADHNEENTLKERAKKHFARLGFAVTTGWAIITTVWSLVEAFMQEEVVVDVICNNSMLL